MKKGVSISIPKPCTESWEQMVQLSNGGFCESCNKTVKDFTKMRDNEVLAYLTTTSGKTCGRFRRSQIKTYYEYPALKLNPGFTLPKAGLLSLFLMVAGKPSQAQSNEAKKQETEIVQNQKTKSNYPQTERKPIELEGVVVDENGSPLPGINVVVKGTTIGTVTDIDGKFFLPERVAAGERIIFSFIGLESKEYIVPYQKENPLIPMKIDMKMCDYIFMGEVAINSLYTEHPSGTKRVWHKLKSLF